MRIGIIVVFVFCAQMVFAQSIEKPKLVVGIVVDQMRAEYLYRFQDNYSDNGFKRLIKEGFTVKNMHYNYVPTATGPGHASIYTGTTPANHGIVANDWYDRKRSGLIYCAEDESVFLTEGGSDKNKMVGAHSRSPRNLKATTITDELKLFTNARAKVIGISLKDRGAIFPAGHLADGAFWYDTDTGNFVSSSYYSETLPEWVTAFNKRKVADSLLDSQWDLLLPKESYTNSGPDNEMFEKRLIGKKYSVFPYGLEKLRKKNGDFALIAETPFGNTILTELAKAAITGAKMGRGKDIDFLTLSFSSTDYIGHAYGLRSKEVEDTYIRLDREVAELLDFLDTEIGKGDYLLFLTADHGASDHPVYLEESRLPGKFYDPKIIRDSLEGHLSRKFGKDDYVVHIDKVQVYFKEPYRVNIEIINESVNYLKKMRGVKAVYAPNLHASRNLDIDRFFRKSHNADSSGDILMHFKPGWMLNRDFGASHATAYNNDTHVPMLWYGWVISKGKSAVYHEITQIASTLSLLLDVPLPDQANKRPIEEVFDKD